MVMTFSAEDKALNYLSLELKFQPTDDFDVYFKAVNNGTRSALHLPSKCKHSFIQMSPV